MQLGDRSDSDFDDFALAAWPRLRWSAYLLCGDHHLAEDLAQTALVRTYARWGSVRRADAMAYTRRVLVNLNIDRVRRRRPVELGDLDVDATASPDRTAGSDDRDEVVRLLSALTEKERRVVVLRHYFDLSEAAVAAELGMARGTVKSTLSRALAKLRADQSLSGRTS
ncbi:SigE family RNA polymerase sigma factor [Nocardioides sp. MAHUQ-72]|uniref:SigE family RNA polymerase sigma factor n=1 Tax=unclassified Nocardioides TaxID=2615069 RepID=UPI0036144430